ncbi:MAG: glutamate racemase [Clostridia bacterium]|nr:glutamate racemase [Clostridia bacterium]MBR0438899.1 glutamate racemase [Clostridia bacterium]
MKKTDYIGFFDSGLGGLSVLKHALQVFPEENYIFFADCGHFPYGEKTPEQVREYSIASCDRMYEKGIKALVIACNTATSAAIHEMREKYQIPVISMEPAVKPAMEADPTGKIIVMATPGTIASGRYKRLIDRLGCNDRLINIPCKGLADLVEKGDFESEEIYGYIKDIFVPHASERVTGIVLGCTHYSFVRNAVEKTAANVFRDMPEIYDGMYGTVRQLGNLLRKDDMLSESGKSEVIVMTSGTEEDRKLIEYILKK